MADNLEAVLAKNAESVGPGINLAEKRLGRGNAARSFPAAKFFWRR
jgi:hypothetical protein